MWSRTPLSFLWLQNVNKLERKLGYWDICWALDISPPLPWPKHTLKIKGGLKGKKLWTAALHVILVKFSGIFFFFLKNVFLDNKLFKGFPGGSVVKNPPVMQETRVWSLGREDSLEKEMAAYSCLLAGKSHGQRSLEGDTPWGRKRVGNDLVTKQQQQQKQTLFKGTNWNCRVEKEKNWMDQASN